MQFVLHVYVYVYIYICERFFSSLPSFKLEMLKFFPWYHWPLLQHLSPLMSFMEKALHLPLIPFLCQFPPLSKWQFFNNKETLDRFNASFPQRNQGLTIQKTGYCFSYYLHNGKVKWLNIEIYNTCHILGSMDTSFRVPYLCRTYVIPVS